MSIHGTTLAVALPDNGVPHKVTKVVPYSDGGFCVLMPYHPAKSGFLAKMPVNYSKIGVSKIPMSELVPFKAENRVKLSYHIDGFVQFSSETRRTIISGRDPDTGMPRGLGLMTSPLCNPIRQGPSVSVVLWGLQDFDGLPKEKKNCIIFGQEDVYFRGCTPTTANAWVIEMFVFQDRYWAGVRSRNGRYTLSIAFGGFEASTAVVELIVIPFPGQRYFIGAFASRLHVNFQSRSGWVLGGPGTRDQDDKGYVLQAMYPAIQQAMLGATELSRPAPSTDSGVA